VNFNYGYSELKDKPVVISQEDPQAPAKNLGQTAAQIWLLSRVFSIFGESYACHCPDVWKLFTTMLEITGICLSRKITINILGYLQGLIKEHLQLFKDVVNQNITPKQHYLVHLPTHIFKFGPTVRDNNHSRLEKVPRLDYSSKKFFIFFGRYAKKWLQERQKCEDLSASSALSNLFSRASAFTLADNST